MYEDDDDEDWDEREETEDEEMGNSVPITELVGGALRGSGGGTCSNRRGCREPIALVKATDNDKSWFFTDNNTDIVEGVEVVFGDSPENMISALEIYLGMGDPRLRYVRNNSWGNEYSEVVVLDNPVFNFCGISDVAILMQLIDEHGSIAVQFSEWSDDCYMEIKKTLALAGYFVPDRSNIVRKDPKQAKTYLRRLKNKRKNTENTFWVKDLQETMINIQQFVAHFRIFKTNQDARETFVSLISILSMVEGVYGPNSRYQLTPFINMVNKWKSTTKRSHAFKKESVAKFVAWLDREALVPDNGMSLITQAITFDNFVNKLAPQLKE